MLEPPQKIVFSLGVVILAAGSSTRMGRPKLLLPWAGTSILGHLLEQWRELRATQIAVVCAPRIEGQTPRQSSQAARPGRIAPTLNNSDVLDELTRLDFPAGNQIQNPNPDRGMFSSIQCAAAWDRWNGSLTHWALVLGDQPHLRQSTLQSALDLAASRPEEVVQPAQAGHRRHPVILPKSAFLRLAKSTASNLSEFLQNCHSTSFESDDPGLDLDIDRPEDYEKALALARLSA